MADKILNIPIDTLLASDSDYETGSSFDVKIPGCIKRQYFFIMNHDRTLVLDVKDDIDKPGASLIMWPRKSCRTDNQVWYYERSTRSIHTKFNDFCLTIKGNSLEVRAYGHHTSQHWKIPEAGDDHSGDHSGVLESGMERRNKQLVLTADRDRTGGFTHVNVADCVTDSPDNRQHWHLVYPKYFLLRSLFKPTYVMEIREGCVVRSKYFYNRYKHEENTDNRLWYIAEDDALCCVQNDVTLCVEGKDVKIKSWSPSNKMFSWSEDKFIEWYSKDKVLEVKLSTLNPSVTIASKDDTQENRAQHWRREFVLFERKQIVTHRKQSQLNIQRKDALKTLLTVSSPD